MLLAIHSKIPFVWFWPEAYSSCAIMTHDVETVAGLNFCESLMDINDSFGVKSSFQLIPEGPRYAIPEGLLNRIEERGYEVNIHDLNHDGDLYKDRREFLRPVERINDYGGTFGAKGFRSAVLYRNPDWYDSFSFSYEMSIPNVGHLDPQRGCCCTVMPFFIRDLLELPLTTIQDYSLFHILKDYSIELWRQQIELIVRHHGLVSFLIHPDYVIENRAQGTYRALLEHLADLRAAGKLWIAQPREVDHWWRARSESKVRKRNGSWELDGPAKERARIAWASLDGDQIIYSLNEPHPVPANSFVPQ